MKDDEADDCEQPAKHWGDTEFGSGLGCLFTALAAAVVLWALHTF